MFLKREDDFQQAISARNRLGYAFPKNNGYISVIGQKLQLHVVEKPEYSPAGIAANNCCNKLLQNIDQNMRSSKIHLYIFVTEYSGNRCNNVHLNAGIAVTNT